MYGLSGQNGWLPPASGGKTCFLSTSLQDGRQTILLHQDGDGGRTSVVAEKIEHTVRSGVAHTGFPHAFAAREEMRSRKFLRLNLAVLRAPDSMLAPSGAILRQRLPICRPRSHAA
jgi:hypothetical protein